MPGPNSILEWKVKVLWDQYDANQNGFVDLQEFTTALTRMNPALASHARSMFNSFDKNNDGVLSFAEFFKMEVPYASMKDIEAVIDKNTYKPPSTELEDKFKMSIEEIEECMALSTSDSFF